MPTKMLLNILNTSNLPANPITPPQQQVTHHNKTFIMANTLDWTKIFKDTNFPAIPDMTPIKYIGEREEEEFDVNALEEEIDDIKDNNELIQFIYECDELVFALV